MKSVVTIAFVALFVTGGYGVYKVLMCPTHTTDTVADSRAARAAGQGSATGSFDPAMSGVCRFSCAAEQPFEARDVLPQPGAIAGRLTRCPVSGVVFEVDDQRPRVALANGVYVLCCDRCAEKLRKDPDHFVHS